MIKTINAATLGALVRDTRVAAGLTQTELGNRIGASRFWVAEFEKGKPSVALGLALNALQALGLTVHVEPKDASERGARQIAQRAEGEHTELASVIARTTLAKRVPSSVVGWPTIAVASGRGRKR